MEEQNNNDNTPSSSPAKVPRYTDEEWETYSAIPGWKKPPNFWEWLPKYRESQAAERVANQLRTPRQSLDSEGVEVTENTGSKYVLESTAKTEAESNPKEWVTIFRCQRPSEGPSTAWQQVEEAFKKHLHKPDIQAARAAYAAIAAHRLDGHLVWPMIVGAPGSMKTGILDALGGLKGIHFIDKLTKNTFISGQFDEGAKKSNTPKSLLHRIGNNGIIAYLDFSTVLEMKDRGEILADMRRVYDGRITKEFGTADNLPERTWEGRITFAVGVTSAIDRHYSVFQSLGERFVLVRCSRAEGIEAGFAAMSQDPEKVKADLQAAVHGLFNTLPDIRPTMATEDMLRLAALTEVVVRARTHVFRAGYGNKEMEYVPDAESNTRLPQELQAMAKGSALLDGRAEVNEQDLMLVQRVAFDCIPPARRQALAELVGGVGGDATLGHTTVHYARQELAELGILQAGWLTPKTQDLLRKAKVLTG